MEEILIFYLFDTQTTNKASNTCKHSQIQKHDNIGFEKGGSGGTLDTKAAYSFDLKTDARKGDDSGRERAGVDKHELSRLCKGRHSQ